MKSCSISRTSSTYEIRSFDEGFEAGIVLDVHVVELDAVGPRVGLAEEVADLVGGDVHHDGLVRRLRHQLLAQVRSDEPSPADHAYRHCRYRLSLQVHSLRH